jgi:NNP family nitrate/nitrite transporter-like MFS transporter
MPIFIAICGGSTELAWRTVSIVPAAVALVTGVVIYRISDDAPKGNYPELRRHGRFPNPGVTVWSSWRRGSLNANSWIMFAQYAGCFGVEIAMNQAIALYFKAEFGQSTEACQAIASIFGWLNLFARGLGGFASDWSNAKWGMRGRLWAQTLMLLAEGGMVFVFCSTTTLVGALVSLIVFSLFVQAAEGKGRSRSEGVCSVRIPLAHSARHFLAFCPFDFLFFVSKTGTNMAIVPYIDPRHMGTVTGITGAGGNVGAVAFGLCFRELSYRRAFWIMGGTVFFSAFLSVFVSIPGHAGLLWGRDRPVDPETGEVLGGSRGGSSRRSDGSGSGGSGPTRALLAAGPSSKE